MHKISKSRQARCRHSGWDLAKEMESRHLSSHIEERNFSRIWYRFQRRVKKEGIRGLKLHATRHTWASMAVQSGKSIRWVTDQLGHADPALALRVYAHAMRGEERDVSFAEFDPNGPIRPLLKPMK